MQSSEDPYLFEKRFWSKVDYSKSGEHDCWVWLGKLNNYGYGIVFRNGKELSAHRVSYELMFGEIPAGLVIDHLCRNRACVNPMHMQPVTNSENVSRGSRKLQTHCIHGHPLSGNNLRIRPDGHRACRTCAKIKSKQYYQRKKEQNAYGTPVV